MAATINIIPPIGGPGLQQVYQTDALDMTQAQSVTLIPALAGYFPVMQGRNWVIESYAGTQTTPPVVRAGNDAGHINFIASTSTTPTNGELTGTAPVLAAGPSFPSGSATRIPGVAVIFDVVSGGSGTGGYAMTARLVVTVAWFASP